MIIIVRCNNDIGISCDNCENDLCISQIPLLSSLNKEELAEISKGVVTTKFKKGEQIFNQGDTGNKLFIICSGKIKIYKYTVDGKEQIMYILSKGDFIGAFHLLKEDKFEFSAQALENTQICTLEKKEFDKIILKNPHITLKVFEKAYERIIRVERLVERLSANNSDAKVAALLVNLVKDFGEKTKDGILLNLSINREEMGSYAGIARETIIRKLKMFEEMELIELIGNKKILIKDISALKLME